MNKDIKLLPPIFSEKLTVHGEIDGLLEIDGSSPGPAGIAALDLGGELLQRDSQGENWNFDLSVDFARPKKLTNIVIDSNSLSEYRSLFEVLIGSERAREASESFQRNSKNLEPKKISKSEQSMFWATTSPFVNYVLAESRAENNQSGDIRELFARIESFHPWTYSPTRSRDKIDIRQHGMFEIFSAQRTKTLKRFLGTCDLKCQR